MIYTLNIHTGIDNMYMIAILGNAYQGYITAIIIIAAEIIIDSDKYSGLI